MRPGDLNTDIHMRIDSFSLLLMGCPCSRPFYISQHCNFPFYFCYKKRFFHKKFFEFFLDCRLDLSHFCISFWQKTTSFIEGLDIGKISSGLSIYETPFMTFLFEIQFFWDLQWNLNELFVLILHKIILFQMHGAEKIRIKSVLCPWKC